MKKFNLSPSLMATKKKKYLLASLMATKKDIFFDNMTHGGKENVLLFVSHCDLVKKMSFLTVTKKMAPY